MPYSRDYLQCPIVAWCQKKSLIITVPIFVVILWEQVLLCLKYGAKAKSLFSLKILITSKKIQPDSDYLTSMRLQLLLLATNNRNFLSLLREILTFYRVCIQPHEMNCLPVAANLTLSMPDVLIWMLYLI